MGKGLRGYWLVLIAIILGLAGTRATVQGAAAAAQDIRFLLQTQAGLASYAAITDSLQLAYVRPLFSAVALETSDYIQGDYTLAGRTDRVKVAIGAGGWAVAWQPRYQASQHMLDCKSFNGDKPGEFFSPPERAVLEIASALGVTNTTPSFYDFRYPQATGALFHWLFMKSSGGQASSLTLPLANVYLERGYVFCTVLNNSRFWLNEALIYQFPYGPSQLIYSAGPLGPDQLLAGRVNQLKIESSMTLFASGFLGAVTAVYTGTTPITSSGGYQRDLALVYPAMLGAPIAVRETYFPIARR